MGSEFIKFVFKVLDGFQGILPVTYFFCDELKPKENQTSLMTHRVTTDKKKQTSKPLGSEIAHISKNLKHDMEVTPKKLLNKTTQPYGYSWSPALFKGSRSNQNWIAQNIFALDFDDGTSPDVIINKFNKYALEPNVLYYTFSSTKNHPKYRLIFFIDSVIKDKEIRNTIQLTLMNIGSECDDACKDASRMYFGGKDGKVLTQKENSLQKILEIAEIQTITNDSGQTRKIDTKIHSNPIPSQVVGVQKTSKSNSSNISNTNFLQDDHTTKTKRWYETHQNQRRNKEVDIQEIADEVKILRDFANNKWLYHDQLFGLATNLYWVRGGFKWMKNIMEEFNKKHEGKVGADGVPKQYSEDNFHILKYIKKKNKRCEGDYYKPQKLAKFSPYNEDHKYHDLLEVISKPRGYVKRIKQFQQVSLSYAMMQFEEKYHKALEADNQKVYFFNLPTGIGKTEKITNLTEVLICAPTHDLKKEIVERIKSKSNTVSATPKIPVFKNQALTAKLEHNFNTGLSSKANRKLFQVASGNDKDAKLAKNYLRNMRSAYKCSNTVVTTHSRGIYTNFENKDTIIFDEDPFYNALCEIDTMDICDLTDLIYELELQDSDQKIIKSLRNLKSQLVKLDKGDYIETPNFDFEYGDLISPIISSGITSNILEVLNSKYQMIDIKDRKKVHYVLTRDLPEKKILIMSATIQIRFYQELYPERQFEVLNLSSKVNTTGKIIQYTNKSYSRQSLSSSIDEINKKLDGNVTITFAQFTNDIKGATNDIYFGKLEGYDTLKGKNINIVGTPYRNPSQYVLTALILNVELEPEDYKGENFMPQMIEWGGYKFKFSTYKHKKLRDIQLSIIRADLIQAVGRARALREDVTVKVYSKMPLPNAKIVKHW